MQNEEVCKNPGGGLCAVLVLAGCGGNGTPEEVTAGALQAIQTADADAFYRYVSEDSTLFADSETWGEGEWQLMKLMYQNLTYEIKGSSIDGDTATVTADITNTDFSQILMTAMSEIVSATMSGELTEADEAKIADFMITSMQEAANGGNVETATETVDITLVRDGSNWKVQTDDALLNALGGGNLDSVTEMLQ